MLACIFPTAIKPTNVSMYPRHIYKERIDDVDITFYTDIPAGTPTTETVTSRAFAARMPRQNMGVIPFAKREVRAGGLYGTPCAAHVSMCSTGVSHPLWP